MKTETIKRIAITGGTGFVGSHVARELLGAGHSVMLISRHRDSTESGLEQEFNGRVEIAKIGIDDPAELAKAFTGCDAVVHCAGINREIGRQTYDAVHIAGTRNVIDACKCAGVPKISITSFLRARPDCGSPYHESKFDAEELVRNSGLEFTVFKPGVIYGRGDHMLDHLSHAFHTFPVFAFVGFEDKPIQPLAVEDFARLVAAAATTDELDGRTIAVTGPEELTLSAAVRRVAEAADKRPLLYFKAPLWFHRILARICEATMKVPLLSIGQVRILSEGIVEPCGDYELPPKHLRPNTPFMEAHIRARLPKPKGFGFRDLRSGSHRLHRLPMEPRRGRVVRTPW
jgi:uncharacterized protein YbjT (DUF2867 family)